MNIRRWRSAHITAKRSGAPGGPACTVNTQSPLAKDSLAAREAVGNRRWDAMTTGTSRTPTSLSARAASVLGN